MSSLDFKGYKKWQRDNCGWTLNPSDKKVKRKTFRCTRRIIKQKLKTGEWSTNDTSKKANGNFLFVSGATSERKARQERKENKMRYHECGNRHLSELKCYPQADTKIVSIPTTCGRMTYGDGSWHMIS